MVGVLCVYYDAYACRATTVRLKVTVNSFLDSTLVPKLNVCVLFRETVARFRSPSPRDRWRSRDRRDRRDRLAIVAIVGDRLAIEAILAIMETSEYETISSMLSPQRFLSRVCLESVRAAVFLIQAVNTILDVCGFIAAPNNVRRWFSEEI